MTVVVNVSLMILPCGNVRLPSVLKPQILLADCKFMFPLLVMVFPILTIPEIDASPTTVSLDDGFVDPMPVLPET